MSTRKGSGSQRPPRSESPKAPSKPGPPIDEATDEVTRVDSGELELTNTNLTAETTQPELPELPSIPTLPAAPLPGATVPELFSGGPTMITATVPRAPSLPRAPAAPERTTRTRRPTGPTPANANDAVGEILRKAANATGGPAIEALERAGEMLAQRGDHEQAAWQLEEAIRRSTESAVDPRLLARVHVTLARLHEEHLGRLDRAVELLEAGHRLDPDQPKAIEAGRRVYRAVGDLEQVARLYEIELETAAPGSRSRRGELLLELADLRMRLDQPSAAAVQLEAALPLAGDPARAEVVREKLANTYAAAGSGETDHEVAQAALRRAGELFRDLARARNQRHDIDGEIACYRRALGVNPDDAEAAAGLEAAYRDDDRDEELLRLYRAAPWLPGAARRLAELAINSLRVQPTNPGVAQAPSTRVSTALDAIFEAASAGEHVDDLLDQLAVVLTKPSEHGRLAALHEQLLALRGELDPSARADRLMVIAREHKQAGDLVRFESSLLDAVAAAPAHDPAYRALAEHLTARRDHAALVAIAENALAAAPPDEHAQRLEEIAELYDKRLGDVAGAVDAWRRRIAAGPSDRAESELRRLRIKEQRWAGMVAQLEKELELAVSAEVRAEVLRRLGQVYRERHDLEKARSLFTDALELRPTDPSLFRTLGEIAELEGRFDELAALLRRQYRVAKERVEKLNLLRRLAALYEERLGDWEGVEWACEEILTHLPSDRDALRRLELVHATKGDAGLEGLLRVLEAHANAAATPTEKVELYRRLAQRYEKAGRYDLAAERWERLVRLDKNDAEATLALARAYERLDRAADAALSYSRLLDDGRGRAARLVEALPEPERVDAARRYARILDQRLSDPTRATVAWQQLLALRPADREALTALSALYRGRGGERALEELLTRRLAVADHEESVGISLELVRLHKARNARTEARGRLQTLVGGLALDELREPLGREALTELIALCDDEGDARGAIAAMERLYFAGDEAERAELARAIAKRWTTFSPSGPATLLAWERVRRLHPEDRSVLVELSDRYAQAGLAERRRAIDLQRLDLAEAGNDRDTTVELGESIADVLEADLADPRAAFGTLERVLGEPHEALHGRVLDRMRDLAERHQLFADLARVLGDEPGLRARIERAQLFEERLREPKKAFEVMQGALAPDVLPRLGSPSEVYVTLVPHLLRLGERGNDNPAVLDALCELLPHLPRTQQAALFRTRAEVREKRMKENGGALDELLRAVAFLDDDDPQLAALDDEIQRLATATRRFEDLVGLRLHRAARAARGSDRRRTLLEDAASLLEHQVRAPRRAFRVQIATLVQLPNPLAPPDALRDELWRLAKLTEKKGTAADALPARTVLPPLPIRAIDNMVVASSRALRDPTLEVDVDDVVIASEKPPRDPTMELQIGDLAEVIRGAPPPRPKKPPPAKPGRSAPPPLPGGRAMMPARPPAQPVDWDAAWLIAAPALDRPLVDLKDGDGPWDELAAVLHSTDPNRSRPTAAARLAVARMWEHGAGKLDLAFAELRLAFLEPDASPEIRAGLDELAKRRGAEEALVAVLDDAADVAGSSDQMIGLLLDGAAIHERQGHFDEAEQRYRRILGIRPDHAETLQRLEAYYRGAERWDALAELLERRLNGLLEKLPPGVDRDGRALELAELYERIGKRYEAIATLEALLHASPDHAGAMVSLAKLYEAQSQWGKLIESLTRRIDALEAGEGSATQPEARRLRLRIAQICEEKLERPERALDAYLALYHAGLHDPVVEAAVERLFTQLGRYTQLGELYERQAGREGLSPDEGLVIAKKRAALHRERAPDPKRLLTALQDLVRLAPDDDDSLAGLAAALAEQGTPIDERIEVAAQRLQAAERRDDTSIVRARRLTELAALEIEAGRQAEAVHTLEQALALTPDDPDSLAQLVKLREGGEDWRGYTEARERQAAAVVDDNTAARALLDAAQVELKHGGDRDRAIADLEQAQKRAPNDPKLLAELRAAHAQVGDDAGVVATIQRELELPGDPTHRAELFSQLGGIELRRGALDQAAAAYYAANEADPGYAPAVHGLANLAARSGNWEDVEPLLRYASTRPGVTSLSVAAFYRRLAEAASARGNPDEAYAALLEADRRQPGDVRTRVQLGRNRFAQNRFREAATHLGVVSEHPDLPRLGVDAAQALYEGAIAELKIKRPERADTLLKIALEIDPAHDLSLGLLSTQANERGEGELSISLRERQAAATKDAKERAQRWEKVGLQMRDDLSDPQRAVVALRAAVTAWDEVGGEARPPAALLEALLSLERVTGQIERATTTAERLLQYGATSTERARRLREAAALESAVGNDVVARERLASAYDLDPGDAETIAGYSALLARLGDDEATAQLLTRALTSLPAPVEKTEIAARTALWQRLGEARDRTGDKKGAAAAFERVLELDPTRRVLRVALLDRYGEEQANEAQSLYHRRLLLDEDPLDLVSLRALERIEGRVGNTDRTSVLQALQAVAGALAVGRPIPIVSASTEATPTPKTPLTEAEMRQLEHPDAMVLSEVFAALYEGTPPDQIPDLAALGVSNDRRVSPVGGEPVAELFAECARIFGNKRTALYSKDEPLTRPLVMVRPPTAVVVSPSMEALPTAELRFQLGRAIFYTRPEHALVVGMPRERVNSLLMSAVRAFHPRHAAMRAGAAANDSDAQRLRRDLPYKVVRRLAELFQKDSEATFSSAKWRRGVEYSADRAGLVVCGDFRAAARVLRDEGDDAALRELARFALSASYMALRART